MSFTPCAGIHLSGPNAAKSAVVVLRPAIPDNVPNSQSVPSMFELVRVYEKIGTFGNLFSDERLASILVRESPLTAVFVDCPLTHPPCVDCTLSSCPGVVRCDDLGVAWMLAVATRTSKSRKMRRRKVNPQGQRLWDVYQGAVAQASLRDPTYTPNAAPLVTRARTLQRRLNATTAGRITLHETSVPFAVESLARQLTVPVPPGQKPGAAYRNFEVGRAYRANFLAALIDGEFICSSVKRHPEIDLLVSSVEVFQALITALVAGLHAQGNTTSPIDGFVEAGGGWVHLPAFE